MAVYDAGAGAAVRGRLYSLRVGVWGTVFTTAELVAQRGRTLYSGPFVLCCTVVCGRSGRPRHAAAPPQYYRRAGACSLAFGRSPRRLAVASARRGSSRGCAHSGSGRWCARVRPHCVALHRRPMPSSVCLFVALRSSRRGPLCFSVIARCGSCSRRMCSRVGRVVGYRLCSTPFATMPSWRCGGRARVRSGHRGGGDVGRRARRVCRAVAGDVGNCGGAHGVLGRAVVRLAISLLGVLSLARLLRFVVVRPTSPFRPPLLGAALRVT